MKRRTFTRTESVTYTKSVVGARHGSTAHSWPAKVRDPQLGQVSERMSQRRRRRRRRRRIWERSSASAGARKRRKLNERCRAAKAHARALTLLLAVDGGGRMDRVRQDAPFLPNQADVELRAFRWFGITTEQRLLMVGWYATSVRGPICVLSIYNIFSPGFNDFR